MKLWPFKRRAAEPVRIELGGLAALPSIPAIPRELTIHHKHERPRPVYACIETQSENGMPLRGNRVSLQGGGSRFWIEVLIPKSGGGFERQSAYLVVEYGW